MALQRLKILSQSKPAYVVGLLIFAALGSYLLFSAKAVTPTASFEAESGTSGGSAITVSDAAASGSEAVEFALPSTALCGWEPTPPTHYSHVIWIWEENKDATKVAGVAPYFDSVASQCGSETNIQDNATTVALPSEPQYAAATSGSNCNTGITSSGGTGTGCITNDNNYGPSNSLTTQSIFQLAQASGGTWKSYQESMVGNCELTSSAPYAYKHNPAAFYTQIASACQTQDVSIPAITCPTSGSAVCTTPTGAFADDIKNGTLPSFAFVTPNLNNDMHDGTVAQGDNWLKTYLPLITSGPNYKAGNTAIFVMWDEGSSNSGTTQDIPSLAVAPSIKPGTVVTTATNNIGLLRTTQEILGLTPYLGCASGTPPGGVGTCNPNSNVSLRTELNL